MDLQPVDTHIHTVYCGHAVDEMTVANLVAAADAQGLDTIAITEHLYGPHHLERLDRIRDDLAAVPHRCRVYVGAEVDAASLPADGSLVADTTGFAYVIASTHQYPHRTEWWNHTVAFSEAERRETIDAWFAWAAALVANPAVDTLAHPGAMLSRNGLTEAFEGEILERFAGLFRVAAEHHTLIELNELLAKKLGDRHRATYPDLIRAAVDAGCRIVVGSDAHQPWAVGKFEWVRQVAEQAGLQPRDLAVPAWHADAFEPTEG